MAHEPPSLAAPTTLAQERRARARALLVEILRAYLDTARPARSRSDPERPPTPAVRDPPCVDARGDALAQLESLLAAAGCPLSAPVRLDAWRDFAGTESFREVMQIYAGARFRTTSEVEGGFPSPFPLPSPSPGSLAGSVDRARGRETAHGPGDGTR